MDDLPNRPTRHTEPVAQSDTSVESLDPAGIDPADDDLVHYVDEYFRSGRIYDTPTNDDFTEIAEHFRNTFIKHLDH